MLPFTKRNARLDDAESDMLGTGEIEVVASGASEQSQSGQRRASLRPLTTRVSIPPAAATSYDDDREPEDEATRIIDTAATSYPAVLPAAGAPPPGLRGNAASVRPTVRSTSSRPAAMDGMSIRHAAPPNFGDNDDDERTIARPISSPPPALSNLNGRGRSARPSPVPAPMPAMLEEQEHTAMMQVPAGIRARVVTMQTPATVMAGAGAIPAELRAQVLAQMQASRAAQPTANGTGSAMDQAIAAQLANVQRAQPISPPAHLMIPQSTNSAISIDAPPTVLTARIAPAKTKGPFAKSTVTWAAALVSMGVFVGLVTAAVVRSDGQAQAAADEARRTNAGLAAKMSAMGSQVPQSDPSLVPQQQQQAAQVPQAQQNLQAQLAQQMAQNPQLAQQAQAMLQNGQQPTAMNANANANANAPQTNMTPAQLAALLGAQQDTPSNSVPAVVTNDPTSAQASQTTASSGHVHAATTHRTAHLSSGSGSSAVADATPAPRPTPTPAPSPRGHRSSGPSANDVNAAADALAKAQLEQSL